MEFGEDRREYFKPLDKARRLIKNTQESMGRSYSPQDELFCKTIAKTMKKSHQLKEERYNEMRTDRSNVYS
jgi:hypothetical protein